MNIFDNIDLFDENNNYFYIDIDIYNIDESENSKHNWWIVISTDPMTDFRSCNLCFYVIYVTIEYDANGTQRRKQFNTLCFADLYKLVIICIIRLDINISLIFSNMILLIDYNFLNNTK